mmetsp:Transcript_46332/g.136842  ORF Transcript_46332/g.136842 Transcript_46332/m.136842 type:complete len:226 (-) Transcript_46332:83-760(-)
MPRRPSRTTTRRSSCSSSRQVTASMSTAAGRSSGCTAARRGPTTASPLSPAQSSRRRKSAPLARSLARPTLTLAKSPWAPAPDPHPPPTNPAAQNANRRAKRQPPRAPVAAARSQGNKCFGLEADDPAGSTYASSLQAWAKPLDEAIALLLINPDTAPHAFSVPTYRLPLTGGGVNLTTTPLDVRDIWARAPLAPIGKGAAVISITVPPLDSAFVRLTPAGAVEA